MEDRSLNQIARTLIEALPYIRQLYDRTIVIKFGGNVSSDPSKLDKVAQDIVLLRLVGTRPVVVHGGGGEISALMKRLDMEPTFVDGLRVTDDETMDVVEMVLVGKVNKKIVSALQKHGGRSVGLSGKDGGLIRAKMKDPRLGRVGEVERIDTSVIETLSSSQFIPVIAPIGSNGDGKGLNINADTLAGELSVALGALKYVVLTDVRGILRNPSDSESLISTLTVNEARQLIDDGVIRGGMLPKVLSCVRAVEGGVERAHILSGEIPHSLVLELLTDRGIGTMICGSDQ